MHFYIDQSDSSHSCPHPLNTRLLTSTVGTMPTTDALPFPSLPFPLRARARKSSRSHPRPPAP
ncbi:hypothetical protein BKA80DRAFT_260039 [Phyllosticta citrichinensis]